MYNYTILHYLLILMHKDVQQIEPSRLPRGISNLVDIATQLFRLHCISTFPGHMEYWCMILYTCWVVVSFLIRIFRTMTQFTPLCPTLQAKDSNSVDLSPKVGKKQWPDSFQYIMLVFKLSWIVNWSVRMILSLPTVTQNVPLKLIFLTGEQVSW